MNKIEGVFYAVVACILALLGLSYAIGWICGYGVVVGLKWNRERFYRKIMDMKQFNVIQFIAYSASIVFIIGGSFLLAFQFMNTVNPYALFAAIFAHRILLFGNNLSGKAGESHVPR